MPRAQQYMAENEDHLHVVNEAMVTTTLSGPQPALTWADSPVGDDGPEGLELLHSQEEPSSGAALEASEPNRSGFLAVFRRPTGGVVVEFHRSAPWAQASAVQESVRSMMNGLLSGPFEPSRIFTALEAQQQQLMSIAMQRQVELAAAAQANPNAQGIAYAAMLPRRPCPRHQAMMLAAKQREVEEAAAFFQNVMEAEEAAALRLTQVEGIDAPGVEALQHSNAVVAADSGAGDFDYYEPEENDSEDANVYADYSDSAWSEAAPETNSQASQEPLDNYDYEQEVAVQYGPAASYDYGYDDDDYGYDDYGAWAYIRQFWFNWSWCIVQLGLTCAGFALLHTSTQALRAHRAQQAQVAAEEAAGLNQPLLYMSPAELMAAVEKVPGAAVVVEAPAADMHWENPIYYERLQDKE